ncbi:MAG: maltotransferase domain-containing protein, partial [Pseudorhodoplanes sp.]
MNKNSQIVESTALSGAFHIENIYPIVDGGRFAVKRIIGEPIEVWADVYRDGHEVIAAAVVWRREQDRDWQRAPMTMDVNDRWHGVFTPDGIGRYVYAVEAWTDDFATWRHGFELKLKAGQDVTLDALEGAGLMTKAQSGGPEASALILQQCEAYLQTGETEGLLAPDLRSAMAESQARHDMTRSTPLPLMIDRERARNGAWYEMVPRSQSTVPDQHGTFRDCIARLPDVEAMGFDVLYFTPIHPIGMTNRKGKNNSLKAEPGDVGSPYAIGGAEGGHDAIHPELGTMEDFHALLAACKQHDMEVAIDVAVQCSPDHPWVKQ